jgi:hypothetical protein
MDLNAVSRDIARQQYPPLRRSLTALEERVIARYWDEDAFVRVTYKRFLAALDRYAEQLLGEDVPGTTGTPGATGTPAPPAAPDVPDLFHEPTAAPAAEPSPPAEPAAELGTVNVTFTLPAEVQAETVALCGEFNDWSVNDIRLERSPDGTWRAVVALEPGSYRYKYLLDGQRWENAAQADHYAPNPYGGVDSVIIVGP